MPVLGKLTEPIYALVRIVAGFLYACHGAQKLFGAFGGHGSPHGIFLAGGIIETVCGALIILGLFGSFAGFIASGELAVVYFKFHYPHAFWPIQNGGEFVVAGCFFFLYVAARGSGSISVDAKIARKRSP